jgi:predicted HicB family RNase H-like nuclease
LNPSSDVQYALRLPKKVHAAMKRIAKQDDRSLNWLIVKACEELIAKREAELIGGGQ